MKLPNFKSLEPWQCKKIITIFGSVALIAIVYLIFAVSSLAKDRTGEDYYWNNYLQTDPEIQAKADQYSQDAVPVSVGTYVENLKEINMKSGYFRIVMLVWFRWEGDKELDMKNHFRVYKGYMNKQETVKEYYEDGVNYQQVRCDVSVTKEFWAKRFPLDSQQLRVYLESQYLVDDVIFVNDNGTSSLNANLTIPGYYLKKAATAITYYEYKTSFGDPRIQDAVYGSEHLTALEINRSSWGLYAKCFMALVGTLTWCMITLYINTYHRVDPLGMLPAALFGTVTNIMVGANLLPDALQMGLLEYTNFWGIFIIISVAISVININRIRNNREDKEFAAQFGTMMFFLILTMVVVGNIVIPVSAYMFQ